ncbi:uncharacterized protein LOC143366916 isoform X2 [Andrena cerasifolii]|uniref:uncharacterized protein LOC143366916 isoform X2 n=1 Tax=Andrena cerasifolii TaxID=2819439 RepID=UPI00403836CF
MKLHAQRYYMRIFQSVSSCPNQFFHNNVLNNLRKRDVLAQENPVIDDEMPLILNNARAAKPTYKLLCKSNCNSNGIHSWYGNSIRIFSQIILQSQQIPITSSSHRNLPLSV